jgi:hypothetical protein
MSEPEPSGRNHLDVNLRDQSIGLSTTNLLSILMLAVIAGGGYLLWVSMTDRLNRLDTTAERIHQGLQDNRLHNTEVVFQLREEIRQLLVRHEHNSSLPPEQRMPLDLEPPPTTPGGTR